MSTTTRPAAPDLRSSQEDDRHVALLLRQASEGDTDAFAAVYDTLVPRVWAMARSVAGDRDLAEAATEQAFEDLWHAAPSRPSAPEAATAWAMGIAVRRCVRAVGRGRRRPAGQCLDPCQDDRVRAALLALPDGQRDAMLLSCYGRLPLGKVAYALDVSRQDASALLCGALIRLGELLRIGRLPAPQVACE